MSSEPAEVPRVDPARIRTVAAQAYHDVLARDDRCRIDPQFAMPVAEIVLRLNDGSEVDDPDTRIVAEIGAPLNERKLRVQHLKRRTMHLFDTTIEESEVDAAALGPLPAGLKAGDRLAPEQVEALANGIRLHEIAGEVEERLRENGIDLPQGHVDRRAVALAITRAKLRALYDVAKRDRGAPVETPERPACPPPPEASPPSVPRLSEMHARWIKAVRPGPKQVDDNARYFRLFIGLHGDLAVDRIDPPPLKWPLG